MVEAGVGVVVGFVAAAVVKAAAIVVEVVKVDDCCAAVGQVAAEAQLVVDWQGCFAKEVVLGAESGRAYLMTGANIVVDPWCVDHP